MSGETPVVALLRHVWDNTNEAKGHSWLRLNQSMGAALRLAIEGGFKFEPDDFEQADKAFRGGRWFGENDGERFYSLACSSSNKSAAVSYEAYRGRKPFLYEESLCEPPFGGGSSGGRIYVGLRFAWEGEFVTCTSVADDGLSLTACGYDGTDRTPKRRYRIDQDGLKAVRGRLRKITDSIANQEEPKWPDVKALSAEFSVPEFVADRFLRAWLRSKVGERWQAWYREESKKVPA